MGFVGFMEFIGFFGLDKVILDKEKWKLSIGRYRITRKEAQSMTVRESKDFRADLMEVNSKSCRNFLSLTSARFRP